MCSITPIAVGASQTARVGVAGEQGTEASVAYRWATISSEHHLNINHTRRRANKLRRTGGQVMRRQSRRLREICPISITHSIGYWVSRWQLYLENNFHTAGLPTVRGISGNRKARCIAHLRCTGTLVRCALRVDTSRKFRCHACLSCG